MSACSMASVCVVRNSKGGQTGGEGKMLEAMGHMRSVKVKNYEKRIRP